jgi:hypothetical protein
MKRLFPLLLIPLAALGCSAEIGDAYEDDLEEMTDTTSAALTVEYKEGAFVNGWECANPQEYWREGVPAWGTGIYCENVPGSADEFFYAEDLAGDGFSPGVLWQLLDSNGNVVRNGICRNAFGAGTLARCTFAFVEDRTIRMRLARCDKDGSETGVAKSCKEFSHWQNKGSWQYNKT